MLTTERLATSNADIGLTGWVGPLVVTGDTDRLRVQSVEVQVQRGGEPDTANDRTRHADRHDSEDRAADAVARSRTRRSRLPRAASDESSSVFLNGGDAPGLGSREGLDFTWEFSGGALVHFEDLQWTAPALPEPVVSDAAAAMIKKKVPLVVSHHDFDGMTGEEELNKLTAEMESCDPDAIKVVQSASTLTQSVQMLKWVDKAKDEISRIGFAMGLKGTCSRLLTMAYGAPITYASFGKPVAPGQISIDDLLNLYQVPKLNQVRLLWRTCEKTTKKAGKINKGTLISVTNQLQQSQSLLMADVISCAAGIGQYASNPRAE